MLGVAEEPTTVRQGRRVCHVDADSMSVAERRLGNELMEWRPSVSVCDDTIKADLMEIGSLEL